VSPDILTTPCCKDIWFHRSCVQVRYLNTVRYEPISFEIVQYIIITTALVKLQSLVVKCCNLVI
jgi:hypothetical protein